MGSPLRPRRGLGFRISSIGFKKFWGSGLQGLRTRHLVGKTLGKQASEIKSSK